MMFEQLWKELEKESADITTSTGILKRMTGSDNVCPMFLGIKKPDMTRVFILQVPKDIAPLPEVIPESKGFNFMVRVAGDEIYPYHVSLILSSVNTEYNDVFSSISEDLFSKLNGLKIKKEIVSALLNRVRLWQIFFEKQGAEGLSEDAQKGLYGELLFLDKYVLTDDISHELSLRFWTGPQNRQHDFQFGNMSVEVKTTSAKQHQKLHISSEQQLDETLVNRLYLFYLSVSLIENRDETLPALIRKIREILADETVALALFHSALLERGYLDVHEQKYEHTGYSIRDSRIFLVIDNFPRIKEAELRNGVGDVKYSVLVAECFNYEVSENDFIKELQEILQ